MVRRDLAVAREDRDTPSPNITSAHSIPSARASTRSARLAPACVHRAATTPQKDHAMRKSTNGVSIPPGTTQSISGESSVKAAANAHHAGAIARRRSAA